MSFNVDHSEIFHIPYPKEKEHGKHKEPLYLLQS